MPSLEVRNPALHALVAPDSNLERIAGGLKFTEGPTWLPGACRRPRSSTAKRSQTTATRRPNGSRVSGRMPGRVFSAAS